QPDAGRRAAELRARADLPDHRDDQPRRTASRRLRDRRAILIRQAERPPGRDLEASGHPRAAHPGCGRQGADLRPAQPDGLACLGDWREQLDGRMDGPRKRRRHRAVQRRGERLEQRRLSARRLHLREDDPQRAGTLTSQKGQCPSFDPFSPTYFVMTTRPKIWVHSETMLPTTCPAFPLASIRAYRTAHSAPVTSRAMVNEWSTRKHTTALCDLGCGGRLSADPISCRYFVATTMTSVPSQSAV